MKEFKMRYLIFLSTLLFFSGCASSERLSRLSGGVVQEYSAPQKHRLRSEKFQKKTTSFSRQENKKRPDFAEKSLINIWPFFFRSDDYYSALWPFFDYDPYGIAFRPFFNKEGDDYSVFFPLTSWNPAAKEGWVTLFYWSKDTLGFIPLAHHSLNREKGATFLTPLFIKTWKYNKSPDWHNRQKENIMTSLLLGYYRRSLDIDTSKVHYLYPISNNKYPQYLKELLAYKLYGTNTPVPQNLKELQSYRKKVFNACPVSPEYNYGFVPLFFGWNEKQSKGFNVAGLLLHSSKKENHSNSWGLFHLLYSYAYRKNNYFSYLSSKEKLVIPPLLFYRGRNDYPQDTPRRRKIKSFKNLTSSNEPFSKNLPEMKKIYKELAGKEMPQVICSYPLAKLWIEELAEKEQLQTRRESFGGVLPLFNYFSGKEFFEWNIPALLTFSSSGKKSSFFLSIPLLTWWKSNQRESVRSTAGVVGYYNKIRKSDRIYHPVFDRKTYWAKPYQQHHFEDTYALCGLYYHGRDGFSIAKSGLDAKKIESIRSRAFVLKGRYEILERTQKNLERRLNTNRSWQVKSRLDELKKMVDSEEIRIEKEKFDKSKKEFDTLFDQWRSDAASFGVNFDRSMLEKKNFDPALDQFLEKTTDLRCSEDFGSGIFFRKELAENKDYKWHIFCYLASGSKEGEREKTQVLHFLYRKNKDGQREEKIIFPFITIRKNKDFSSSSFLWRLWETHESPKGKGGYIFFIPWGN